MTKSKIQAFYIPTLVFYFSMLGGIPVPTAWRVLGLRMEVSCEYIE
jgi:hypothetical protein